MLDALILAAVGFTVFTGTLGFLWLADDIAAFKRGDQALRDRANGDSLAAADFKSRFHDSPANGTGAQRVD